MNTSTGDKTDSRLKQNIDLKVVEWYPKKVKFLCNGPYLAILHCFI